MRKSPLARHNQKYAGIYTITIRAEGAVYVYVGKSNDVIQRYHQHQYSLRKGNHANPAMQDLYNKHGAQSFEMEIIELVNDTLSLERREIYWIRSLSPALNVVHTKLSPLDVEDIKLRLSRGETIELVAQFYDISRKYLLEICRGDRWGRI